MEATEHAFFRSLGFTVHGHDPVSTTGWPRVNATCTFKAPLRFEEEVEIHLLVAQVRSRSIRYEFIFRRGSDRTEVAHGTMSAVCASVEKATGKISAVPIPEGLRAQITAAPAELLPQHRSSAVAADTSN
jgi:acyl-CoA thioester hydrolase